MTDTTSNRGMDGLSLTQFLEALASGESTPGGGAAAGMAGAMAAALVAMVCRLTIGRPKYAEVTPLLEDTVTVADRLRGELLALADADAAAYLAFSAALALPRSTDAEKAARSAARQAALVQATEVPLKAVALSRQVAELAVPVAQKGNQTARSDAVSATLLARATAGISSHNVEANLGLLKDAAYAKRVTAELHDHLAAIERAAAEAAGDGAH